MATLEVAATDINPDTWERWINEIVEIRMTEYKRAGEHLIKITPEYKNMTWQEAYCREHAINHEIWNNSDLVIAAEDWEGYVDTYANDMADVIIQKAFPLEVEVRL